MYDGLYRLTAARYDYRTLTHGFTYDDLGNQLTFSANATTKAGLYNSANELTKYAGTSVYYDKNGNLTKDAAASPGPYTYYYDRRNQLTKVTKVVDESETDVAEYSYDALARRIEFIDAVNTVTKRYYHDSQTAEADRVIEEYDAGGNRQRYYIWGYYVDELILMNDDAGDDSDYFVCHNHLFSPEALVDSDGDIVERYDYDAYGKPVIYTADGDDDTWFTSDDTTATVSAKGLVYLFTGREYDALDTNANLPLQYSRARYYSFPLRRWLQRDPIGYADGMSLYEYAKSGPTNRVDPGGTIVVTLAGWLQSKTSMKSISDNIARKIRHKIKTAKIEKYYKQGKIHVDRLLLGLGGKRSEKRLLNAYNEFQKDKDQEKCLLEQFVAVGYSDGATAIFRLLNKGNFRVAPTPAYLGMIDLVRRNYFLFFDANYSMSGEAHLKYSKPEGTYIQAFRQINWSGNVLFFDWIFGGWKGREVIGLTRKDGVTSNYVDNRLVPYTTHMNIIDDLDMQEKIAKKASDEYVRRVKAQIRELRNKNITVKRITDRW